MFSCRGPVVAEAKAESREGKTREAREARVDPERAAAAARAAEAKEQRRLAHAVVSALGKWDKALYNTFLWLLEQYSNRCQYNILRRGHSVNTYEV